MSPGIYDFTLIQGAHDGLKFQITNNGVAEDLTGYTAAMQVRADYDKPVLLQATTADKIVIDPLLGLVTISFTAHDTSAISFKGESLDCIYAIELTSPAGITSRVLEGTVSISREVVR